MGCVSLPQYGACRDEESCQMSRPLECFPEKTMGEVGAGGDFEGCNKWSRSKQAPHYGYHFT